jgi:hypothetical protein
VDANTLSDDAWATFADINVSGILDGDSRLLAESTGRNGEGGGLPGSRERYCARNFLILLFGLVDSNPTLSATRDINSVWPGSVDRNGNEAGITPARAAPKGRGAAE